MEPQQQRPPRSVPPPSAQQQQQQHQPQQARSPLSQQQQPNAVSFALNEQGDRAAPLPSERRQKRYSASVDPNALTALGADGDGQDPESLGAKMARKKSLVRPDRERIDSSHPHWHYRTHAARFGEQNGSNMAVLPSSKPLYDQIWVQYILRAHISLPLFQLQAISPTQPHYVEASPSSRGTRTLQRPVFPNLSVPVPFAEERLPPLVGSQPPQNRRPTSGIPSPQALRTHG